MLVARRVAIDAIRGDATSAPGDFARGRTPYWPFDAALRRFFAFLIEILDAVLVDEQIRDCRSGSA